VAFQQISFVTPDAQQFKFNPPPGAKVQTPKAQDVPKPGAKPDVKPGTKPDVKPGTKPDVKPGAKPGTAPSNTGEPTVVGTGWTSILVTKLSSSLDSSTAGADGQQITGLLNSLPKISGTWGSGRVLKSALFSALLTDDGRVLVGAVAPEKLYEAAGK
jgi:hypothetical protein